MQLRNSLFKLIFPTSIMTDGQQKSKSLMLARFLEGIIKTFNTCIHYENDIKIAVAGTGYVGLSIATLLSQHHQVVAVDVVPEKVELINSRKSPIQDDYIEKYLAEKDLNLTATLDGAMAYVDADFVVIATPTNYDAVKTILTQAT